MMSSAKFLDYEVALLLAKYGRSAVSRALAEKVNMTVEELEAALQALPTRAAARHPRKKHSLLELAEQLGKTHPEKASGLRELAIRFENRAFLPELRDVKRFFGQHIGAHVAAKSRGESGPRVLNMLANLDISELNALCREEPANSYSSLGLISDQILGHRR